MVVTTTQTVYNGADSLKHLINDIMVICMFQQMKQDQYYDKTMSILIFLGDMRLDVILVCHIIHLEIIPLVCMDARNINSKALLSSEYDVGIILDLLFFPLCY